MSLIESAWLDFGHLELLSRQDTAVHRLDPRVKVLVTAGFLVTVASYGKYDVTGPFPLLLYLVVVAGQGRIPLGFLVRKLLPVLPFALLVGLFNPLLDREAVALGPFQVAAGWLSFLSILVRASLSATGALLLIAVAGLSEVAVGLGRLRVPRVFVVQLVFLYRYIFVLAEEGIRVARARALRSFDGRGLGLQHAGSILGRFLLRTMDRAGRIHQAMVCRGFDGEIRILRPLKLGPRDLAYLVGWAAYFASVRMLHPVEHLGRLIAG